MLPICDPSDTENSMRNSHSNYTTHTESSIIIVTKPAVTTGINALAHGRGNKYIINYLCFVTDETGSV